MQSLTTGIDELKVSSVEVTTQPQPRSRLKQTLLIAAEVVLILAIIGLLIAIWLPAWIGPHPGLNGRQ